MLLPARAQRLWRLEGSAGAAVERRGHVPEKGIRPFIAVNRVDLAVMVVEQYVGYIRNAQLRHQPLAQVAVGIYADAGKTLGKRLDVIIREGVLFHLLAIGAPVGMEVDHHRRAGILGLMEGLQDVLRLGDPGDAVGTKGGRL